MARTEVIMVTPQYVNDLSIAFAKQTLIDGKFYLTDLICRVLKNKQYKIIFMLEYRNYLYSLGVPKPIIESYLSVIK